MINFSSAVHKLKQLRIPKGKKNAKYWMVIWSLLFIAAFFYATKPSIFFPAQDEHYTSDSKGVSKDNKWSRVTPEGKGAFFMHPGEEEPTQLIINTKKEGLFKVDLSIREGSKHGDILFTTYKNGDVVNVSEVLTKQGVTSFTVKLAKKDTLTVVADKNGVTSSDWGEVKLLKLDSNYVFLLIASLALWLLALGLTYQINQAAYVVANFFIFFIYVLAERVTFHGISPASVLGYTSVLVGLALVFSLVYNVLSFLKLSRSVVVLTGLLLILIAASPLAFISYKLSFGTPIAKEALFAIFQSNFSEGVEFVSDFISLKAIIIFLVSVALIFSIIWWHRNSQIMKPNFSAWFSLLLSMTIIASIYASEAKLPQLVQTSLKEYKAELDQFKKLQDKRKVSSEQIKALKSHEGETYVVILGESLNKQHMQVYGYSRDTTPKLQIMLNAGELHKFTNTYSNHTHTMPVLSLALTEAAQDKNKNYYESASIVEVFNAAGFETVWLTNQNLLGDYDNLVSIIAKQSDKVVGINSSIGRTTKGQRFDGDLLQPLARELKRGQGKNKLIFVHLMGNHSSYCSRFPEDFNTYKGALDISVFGKNISENKALKEAVNCYDNSVLYNDYVVSSMIDLVKQQDGVSSVFYIADHADDVFARLGHNSAKFTDSMTQIPFLAWFSPEYKQRYPEKIEQLAGAQKTLFSNDRLYDTIIGWSDVDTPMYRSEFDLTNQGYEISAESAETLHGRRKYADPKNHFYWQSVNFDYLVENQLADKFFPHRVNSIGKLKELWELGFRSFETDVVFDYKNDGKFYVGHNHGVMGTDFENFLKSVDYKEINRMWFDFKNLNAKNYQQALAELERLDDIFELKDKIIVESGWTGDKFNVFSDAGWHTSYYLPTDTIVKLLKEEDEQSMESLAENISKQVLLQKTSAVSFDTRLYPFVKKHLEEKLLPETVYHAWYGPNLASTNYKKTIEGSELYNDPRVKTFLSTFNSYYNL
ncbi:sulfatase-like hydrolase/transferase [Escherichia coli]|uniref:sulfatase-like hydrolase/transferase n=1 Tax=Escherichia coli TaxID=562 RepID=UPI001243A662|nr:sulfatase-like hydrolase/transferase [Escherichia coli]MBZ2255650.1 sulfatase-like hydrolase/transferase [Escherichia coli]MBZ2260235.1 sulfatase-like hydrolase/transferase [Escherichia coli]MBZ2269734.1 sulfatase-like hydrolase/transferase [Escherichia coli]MBZ2274492.1 sulfatase-like hydrolase/transferase [Escherichia coli]MBZ2284513.1 sulfatase-like hydrolase/transferase [Escherichia coli]